MNEIIAGFNRVRYAADATWEPRGGEPIGFSVPGTDINPEFPRRIAADYLRENGREDEADLVQHHDGPVALKGNAVVKGRYSPQPVLDAMRPLELHLDDWSGQGHRHPYIETDRGDHGDHFDEPLPADHVHVASGEGDLDGNEPAPYADVEHDEVHYDDLADHIATIISDQAAQQHRHNWGPHTRDDEYHVTMDSSANDDLDTLHQLHNLNRYRSLSSWRRLGEGGVGDTDAAINELESIISRAEDNAPDEDEDDGSHSQLITTAQRLISHFESLRDEPERLEKQNQDEFERLLADFRKTRPVVPAE
jgi:hypothetical protein